MTKLVVPQERFCWIDFFLENFKDPKKVSGIKIESSAYERMKKDPDIWLIESMENSEIWGKKDIEFSLWRLEDGFLVVRISKGNKDYVFSQYVSVIIS